jgi:hypothetical protein
VPPPPDDAEDILSFIPLDVRACNKGAPWGVVAPVAAVGDELVGDGDGRPVVEDDAITLAPAAANTDRGAATVAAAMIYSYHPMEH